MDICSVHAGRRRRSKDSAHFAFGGSVRRPATTTELETAACDQSPGCATFPRRERLIEMVGRVPP